MALSHAILVAIAETPCSGYDLSKRFAGSVGYFWYASQQQIYRELTKMEEQGYLSSTIVHQEGRPDKRLLTITEAGRELLQTWIAAPAEISPVKDDLLVKVFGGGHVSPQVLLQELRHHQQQHQIKLQTYRTIEAQCFAPSIETMAWDKRCRYLTLRNGICYEESWLAWCEEAIAALDLEADLEVAASGLV
ncbi:PadR family transcriptional regulator [Alkalinema sp. FACHB-956]|uniref:PadR family transcriptional regulator n=1 Tax=Alkalinema sp. FACHB-956 TaxID=2692768 RepID=UPI001683B9C4|nr:PadR family transcriptional regulator [Alkalinema sp. FACHB-956]MBD2330099.1 PadR family transcriptional regulator [Alkalinema sp. FACHB-956]